jgi:hypothetical protein
MSLKEPLPNGRSLSHKELKAKEDGQTNPKNRGISPSLRRAKKSGDFSPLFIVFIIEA